MENLFENDAIINGCYKEFVTASDTNSNYLKKDLFSGNVTIQENYASKSVDVCNFFSVLSGELTIELNGYTIGSGLLSFNMMVKNLHTGDTQTFSTSFQHHDIILVDKFTPYQITVSGKGDGVTVEEIHVTDIYLEGAVKNIPDRYIISEQL